MNESVDPTLVDGVRPYPTRCILYPDGRRIDREAKISHEDITSIICDDTRHRSLSTVNLRDGHVMLIHDLGHPLNLPVNPGATNIYWGVCIPGTTHEIRGTVVIVPDEDFA